MENKTTIKRLTYILCLIGLILIYSASNIVCLDKYNDSFYYLKRQAIFFFIGLFLMKITSGIDYHILIKKANNVLIISSILLVLVLIPGIGIVRGGSQSWFSLGPISFQPSELFKVSIILFLSNYLSGQSLPSPYPFLPKFQAYSIVYVPVYHRTIHPVHPIPP